MAAKLRYLNPTMHDSDGNVVTCSFCDKEAGGSIVAKEGFINYCMKEHTFLPKSSGEAKFVYDHEGKMKTKSYAPIISEEPWIINLNVDE